MLSELHSLNLKLCSKQYNKKFVLHLIVVPQLGGGRRHNYSTKTRQADRANEQSKHSPISMSQSVSMCDYYIYYREISNCKFQPNVISAE